MPELANELGRRERQIMDILFRLERATVAQVLAELPDPPTYSAVRGMLRLLEDKGFITHERDGLRYVYLPAESPQKVRRSAVKHLVETFFEGSPAKVVEALVGRDGDRLSDEELDRIAQLIERARREGKRR